MKAAGKASSLEIQSAGWRTPGGTTVLEPMSLTLGAGKVLGVVGANGAGKSTLLRLIYRYNRPHAGRVLIDGDDIWALPARAVAQRVAAVLQEQPTDFALTVFEIVMLGRTPHHRAFGASGAQDRTIVDSALRRLNLSALADRRFGTLSGGERQRVMVARALAQEPGILVLDEPTNHLDIRHQLEVLELIATLGMTIVASLHDLNFAAQCCDEILLLRDGRKLAFGPPEKVLSDVAVSDAFQVTAERQKLHPSNQSHFTYTLQQGH
ncbi:MAG: ABC transporter ATP-binding protein [Pseudomonadota bacterium]